MLASGCGAGLRRAAFGDGVAPSAGELAAAGRCCDRCRLLAAIVLGAHGRYAAAATALYALAGHRDPVIRSLAASTLASHRRQLGGHAAARRLDGDAALAASMVRRGTATAENPDPDGLDAKGAHADALLGLAADAVGLGRPGLARRLLQRTESATANWRTRVRRGWVLAETALAEGQPPDALGPATEAVELADARGAARHAVKSRLILAAALTAVGGARSQERASTLVLAATRETQRLRLASLQWPAELLLVELDLANAQRHRAAAGTVLHRVLLGADPEGRRIARESPWVPA